MATPPAPQMSLDKAKAGAQKRASRSSIDVTVDSPKAAAPDETKEDNPVLAFADAVGKGVADFFSGFGKKSADAKDDAAAS